MKMSSLEEGQVPENNDISLHFMNNGEIMDINKIVVDNVFPYEMAIDITRSNDESESRIVEEYDVKYWPNLKETIHAELIH